MSQSQAVAEHKRLIAKKNIALTKRFLGKWKYDGYQLTKRDIHVLNTRSNSSHETFNYT